MGNPYSVPTFFALIEYGKTTTAKQKKQHINLSIKTNCHNLNHMCNDEHGD